MITGSQQQQLSTARFLTVTIFYPLQITFNQINNIKNIFAENRRLKQDVVQLGAQVAILREQAAENDRLRGMLNLAKQFECSFLLVKVIARDPSEGFRSIVITAGSKDGVQQWMPVVGEKGVVGKVVQVMHNISLVQILRDPANRISVMARRSRSFGILETIDGNQFFVRYRSHEDVNSGDTITTSGLGGIYPAGLTVGFIDRIADSGNPLFKKAYINLAVNFDRTEEMFVMKLSPQWQSFRNEFDSLEINK
jgi:rod shape-determining protein MreC